VRAQEEAGIVIANTTAFPSVVDQLVEQVFQRILTGEYGPGSKITEEQIAAASGASRTPVREALRRLAELGVVVLRPRCGMEVARIDDKDVAEIRMLRTELEALAVREAVRRLKDEDVAQLDAAQKRCEELLDADNRLEVFRRDSEFHLLLARLSGNRYLHDALRRLDAKVLLCRMLLCRSPETIRHSVEYHRVIVDALRKRDARAAVKAMRAHIETAQM
jgi:DNA-binding GntR family transcriptional regulator